MSSHHPNVLLIGATQGVGACLLEVLMAEDNPKPLVVHAISRTQQPQTLIEQDELIVQWYAHDLSQTGVDVVADWVVAVGPVGLVLHQLDHWGERHRPSAVWALSSASPDFKSQSSDLAEREQMREIEQTEQALLEYCKTHHIDLQLFKTTMLYGRGDGNINRLADLMNRLALFPVAGNGKRAPVHVEDVASLIQNQLHAHMSGAPIETGVWRLQGGECLGYRAMLERIAQARGIKVRFLSVPVRPMQWLLNLLHATGQLRDVKATMLARQTMDLVVDDADARKRLGWEPGPFWP